MTRDDFSPGAAKRRIERWLLVAGLVVAAFAGYFGSALAAAAVLLGTGLAWLNFHWMKEGLAAFEQVSRQQMGETKVRIPKSVMLRFFARTALILIVLYVSLAYSLLPAWALLAGIFTLVAAVMGESVYQMTSRRGGSR
ncbi:MAG TPA: ATP synthase subunit I [Candidatus Acidoferrales bacterium]|nr:ATP synthase subunit I [Candidatus Acidoferrales bacterium]